MSDTKVVGLALNITGLGQEQVILEGQDISHITQGVEVRAEPGELLSVTLRLFLNRETAVKVPNTLASVSVIDDARSINLEVALGDLLTHLVNYTSEGENDFEPELLEAIAAAKKVIGADRDRNDTVEERKKKIIW